MTRKIIDHETHEIAQKEEVEKFLILDCNLFFVLVVLVVLVVPDVLIVLAYFISFMLL